MITKISFYLFITCGLFCLGFFISNLFIDSYLDQDDFLHQPFYLIYLGYAVLLFAEFVFRKKYKLPITMKFSRMRQC